MFKLLLKIQYHLIERVMEFLNDVPDTPSRLWDDNGHDGYVTDEECVSNSKPECIFRWSKVMRSQLRDDGSLCCDSLIIALGNEACNAVVSVEGTQFRDRQPLATLVLTGSSISHAANTVDPSSPYSMSCLLFDSEDGLLRRLILVCSTPVPSEAAFDVASAMFKHITPSTTQALMALPIVSYSSGHSPPDSMSFLRMLSTKPKSNRSSDMNIPELNIPNVVDGVAAALLSECAVRSLSCNLIIAFTEMGSHRDSVDTIAATRALMTVLDERNISNVIVDNTVSSTMEDSMYL